MNQVFHTFVINLRPKQNKPRRHFVDIVKGKCVGKNIKYHSSLNPSKFSIFQKNNLVSLY